MAAKVKVKIFRWLKDQWAEEFKPILIQSLTLWPIISMIYLQATKNYFPILSINLHLATFYPPLIIVVNILKQSCSKHRNKFQIEIFNISYKIYHIKRVYLRLSSNVNNCIRKMTVVGGLTSPEFKFWPTLSVGTSPESWKF